MLGLGGCAACLIARHVVVDTVVTGESRDGKGAADNDRPYTFGNPRGGLTALTFARCLVMRGFVRDVSHAPDSIRMSLRFGGDSDYAVPTNSELWIPDPRWSDDA